MAAAITAIIGGTGAFAADLPSKGNELPLKIAMVDTGKAIESSLVFKDIMKQMDKKRGEFLTKMRKNEVSLKNKSKELEAKKNSLAKGAFESKRAAIEAEAANLQKTTFDDRNVLERAYSTAIQVVSEKSAEVVKTKAQEAGYAVVLEKAIAAYSEPRLDLTATVTNELNKSLPSYVVVFEDGVAKEDALKDGVVNNTAGDKKADSSVDESSKK